MFVNIHYLTSGIFIRRKLVKYQSEQHAKVTCLDSQYIFFSNSVYIVYVGCVIFIVLSG